ncbi:hypothetical protein CDAR_586611 [Caerostris darwini]|uniref:Uncharacterized protein n=1 Tax=Caerostris darwini TaxID=1538125 RepID=A0AAV4Q6C8_9ARAC|nr:hypothetical protein CDAR_586611 [Caerostris darwini]
MPTYTTKDVHKTRFGEDCCLTVLQIIHILTNRHEPTLKDLRNNLCPVSEPDPSEKRRTVLGIMLAATHGAHAQKHIEEELYSHIKNAAQEKKGAGEDDKNDGEQRARNVRMKKVSLQKRRSLSEDR